MCGDEGTTDRLLLDTAHPMIALALIYVGLAVMVGVTLAAHRARFIARAVVCVAAPALAFAVYFAAQPPTGWPAAASPPKRWAATISAIFRAAEIVMAWTA